MSIAEASVPNAFFHKESFSDLVDIAGKLIIDFKYEVKTYMDLSGEPLILCL